MWHVVGTSVAGTSHLRNNTPCQDYAQFLHCQIGGESASVIVIADGAGSAAYSHLGAKETVEFLLREINSSTQGIADITRQVVQSWFSNTLAYLQTVALREKIELRDLDCTALIAVLGEKCSVFGQIGDGAWITDVGGLFEVVTWPFKGEFANETKFLTSPDAQEFIQFEIFSEPLDTVAGFTDGIEMLALSIANKSVHAPFFVRMFDELRRCDDPSSLRSPLVSFLSSDRVNQRTDDDKTLMIACRKNSVPLNNELV